MTGFLAPPSWSSAPSSLTMTHAAWALPKPANLCRVCMSVCLSVCFSLSLSRPTYPPLWISRYDASFSLMLLDVAPLNVLNVSDFYAILSHRWSIVPLASRAACLVPASHGLPSSSPLRAFLSTYPALSPHFEQMLRALRRSSTPFSFLHPS